MTNLDVDPNEKFEEAEVTSQPQAVEPELLPQQPEQKPQPAEKGQLAPVRAKPLAADRGGQLVGSTFEEQYRLAKCYCASGLMPKSLNTPEKVLVALQMCRELNLPPMTSIGKIAVINQTPSVFGELPLGLAMRSPFFVDMKETWIKGEKGEIIGARCEVHRRGMEPIVRQFTVEDAKVAKLWEKKSSSGTPTPWVLYPNRMLQMRARSWALKDSFPDVIGGLSIAEYDFNAVVENGRIIGDIPEESRGNKAAEAYKDAYLNEDEADQGPAAPQGSSG